ncbi:hypothetical protein [Pinibacter aurantiacus]|uniref:Uncharacterized protein n=1 Tax=Pinibacter aurantiacus TaxID=2851599 RepID=A0A9E2W309_9BACT|nr:hypothetical protein [Pinibacter aurantiacus]MBV4357975.1 hypothetical protein [Pinibacter aurantiacus]
MSPVIPAAICVYMEKLQLVMWVYDNTIPLSPCDLSDSNYGIFLWQQCGRKDGHYKM